MLLQTLLALSTLFSSGQAVPAVEPSLTSLSSRASAANGTGSCFPALGFQMPTDVPDSLDNWWCDMDDEYAFLGFSYEISACLFLVFSSGTNF